jgi:hypothetical protein
MAKNSPLALLLCLALCGCGAKIYAPTTGYLPDDAFATTAVGQDVALAAVQEAMYAFAYPNRMQGKPGEMALAVASLDAMAGQFSTSGRWLGMNGAVKDEMIEARSAVRAVLGIPDDAPSQAVIDQLMAASRALGNGDEKTALAALSGPVFTKTPEETLGILAAFPPVPVANVATRDADANFFPQDSIW